MKEVLTMTKLKRMRIEKGIRQIDITARCGLAQSQYANYEKYFDVENLTLKTLCKIAKGFDVKLWDIIDDQDIITKLHEVNEYETGFLLDGEKSPIAEIRNVCEITQTQMSNLCRIPQSQICKWERYGMDTAKLKNFIDVAKALHVNLRSLIWNIDLLNLFDEVT